MIGHELAIGGGHRRQALGDRRIGGLDLGAEIRRTPLDPGGGLGVERGECGTDRRDGRGGVARVVPPVGIALDRMRDPVGEDEQLGLGARILDRVLDPRVEVAAAGDHEVRGSERLDVVGPRLVLVRVGVRGQQGGDVDVVAGDVGDEIAGDRRRRGDRGAVPPRRRRCRSRRSGRSRRRPPPTARAVARAAIHVASRSR